MPGFSFYARIIAPPDKIITAELTAAITANCADLVTLEQMEATFNLDTDESNSLQQCINLVCGDPAEMTILEMQGIFTQAETGIQYDTVETLMERLGVTL